MVTKHITIRNHAGIHCRPACVIISEAGKFSGNKFKVTSQYGTSTISSILELLALGLQCGDEIDLEVEGPDEANAAEAISGLFAKEFDFPNAGNGGN